MDTLIKCIVFGLLIIINLPFALKKGNKAKGFSWFVIGWGAAFILHALM